MRRFLRHTAVLGSCLLLASATGCDESTKTVDLTPDVPRVVLPPYDTLAAAQNNRVASINRFWTSASFNLHWRDQDGDRHVDQTDGYIILEPPQKTAVSLTKAGENVFWIGSDEEMYWMFEGGDAPRAFVGRNENAFSPDSEPLPMSFHPLEMTDLLGFVEFPDEFSDARIELTDAPQYNAYAVTIPGPFSLRCVYIDRESGLPTRVELLSHWTREVMAWSELDTYTNMDLDDVRQDLEPMVPTRIVLRVAGSRADEYVRIGIHGQPMDRRSRGRWTNDVFRYNRIARIMSPKERIVLDAKCENPAFAAETATADP